MRKAGARLSDLAGWERQITPVSAFIEAKRSGIRFGEYGSDFPMAMPGESGGKEYVDEAVHDRDRAAGFVGERVRGANRMMQAGGCFECEMSGGASVYVGIDSFDGRNRIGSDASGAQFGKGTGLRNGVERIDAYFAVGGFWSGDDSFRFDRGCAEMIGVREN